MRQVEEVSIKDPDVLGGTPVFRGTRVPFQALLDYLEGGQTLAEFLDDFPTVTREVAIVLGASEVAAGRPTGMKILLDDCIPRKFKNSLAGHECLTVPEAGLAGKKNGEPAFNC